MRKYLSLILLLTLGVASGCAKKVPIHPGAVSNIDSYTYDLLLVEQPALESAKKDFEAGNLPTEAKTPLNAAIAEFNTTYAAWDAYHRGVSVDADKLQASVNALVAAVAALQKSLHKPPAPISDLIWNDFDCPNCYFEGGQLAAREGGTH